MNQNTDQMDEGSKPRQKTSVTSNSSSSSSQVDPPFFQNDFFASHSMDTTSGYAQFHTGTAPQHNSHPRDYGAQRERLRDVEALKRKVTQQFQEAQPEAHPQPQWNFSPYPPEQYRPFYAAPGPAPNAGYQVVNPAFNAGVAQAQPMQQTMTPAYVPPPAAVYSPQQPIVAHGQYNFPPPHPAYGGYAPTPQPMSVAPSYAPLMQVALAPAVAVNPPVAVPPPQQQSAAAAPEAPAIELQFSEELQPVLRQLLTTYTPEQIQASIEHSRQQYGTWNGGAFPPPPSRRQPQMQGTGYEQHNNYSNQGFMHQALPVGSAEGKSAQRGKRKPLDGNEPERQKQKKQPRISADHHPDMKRIMVEGRILYQCQLSQCGGKVLQSSSVHNHVNSQKHSERNDLFPCEDCGQCYARSDAVSRHILQGSCVKNQAEAQKVAATTQALIPCTTSTFVAAPPVIVPAGAFTYQAPGPDMSSVPHQIPPMLLIARDISSAPPSLFTIQVVGPTMPHQIPPTPVISQTFCPVQFLAQAPRPEPGTQAPTMPVIAQDISFFPTSQFSVQASPEQCSVPQDEPVADDEDMDLFGSPATSTFLSLPSVPAPVMDVDNLAPSIAAYNHPASFDVLATSFEDWSACYAMTPLLNA
ncbi:hypothetical protein DFH29DRAFT_1070120 [Suillus ampliporus]|nr:hypothetical protein DFH29DRAFT_1070120 [Suillus ampliporus]